MKRGRKAARGAAAIHVIRVRLTPSERADIGRVARENDTTITEVIREAVNEYAADYRERHVFRNS